MTHRLNADEDPEIRARLDAASEWLLRRADVDWSAADDAAFEAWLQADIRNAEAHARIARLWTQVGDTAVATARQAPRQRPIARSRRWVLGAGVAAAACASVVWMSPMGVAPADGTMARSTPWDATAELALSDGSRVQLNRRSVVETRVTPTGRHAALTQGEAFFDIAHVPHAPFTVATDDATITVLGTAFNVQSEAGSTRVDVRTGRVEVRAGKPAQTLVLAAGEAAQTSADGSLRRLHGPADADSWRTGRLVFRDTPVTEVARRLSRYRAAPVQVKAASTLERLRVSGVVRTDNPDAFIAALPSLVAVRVTRQADGSLQIAPQ